MDDLFMLSAAQMRRIKPFFPLSHGVPRVDDRLIVSAIIFVIKNGLRWRDAPRTYGPHKTIYNPVLSLPKGGSSAGWPMRTAAGGNSPAQSRPKSAHHRASRLRLLFS